MRKLVIIPTYNEKENISAMIDKVFSLGEPFDLLVIDDGSPDGTAAIVRSRQAEFQGRLHLLERSGKLGLGTAYLTGFEWGLAQGYDYICEMDCDFSHNPDDLVRLYRAAAEGADVVVGSRYVQGVNVVNWPMSRLLMSYFASKYVRLVTGLPLNDATAGFVCYSRRALEHIDLGAVRMKGYGFQIEMKYTAWKLGMKLCEVPIIFTERREGASKMSGGIFREAFFGVLGLPFRRIRGREVRR
ncbi:polyprenol monophosphomannose synthase [uncultured Alistipes sp.]|uniref:polyprenol monophosphomannose synthase n=1 Tax=uncultured Alistipes sp. TaxID=538949 RepID=UPI001FA45FCB|nr:polyprenol monophosphomannose synthase [uncultured Alistipes sp.]HJC16643.1 polyprenol monophosphomannose synthase [Candidatus Alistipes stercorigallinarum]